MKLANVSLGNLGELFDLKSVGQTLLQCHLVLARVLHQEDVDDVKHEEDDGLRQFNLVTHQTVSQDYEVEENEDSFTGDDPPVNQGTSWHDKVENAYRKSVLSYIKYVI